jgi:putative FmdB family regulatory protein
VEVNMPHYEFFCQDCKKLFDKILSLVDYEEGDVRCPYCGGKRVEQRWSAFSAITSKKSA